MKLTMELDRSSVNSARFFADAVIWSGETRGIEHASRMIPDEFTPDPGDRCLELKRLTVLDECASATDVGVDCACARVTGRLHIPLEAEFADECGNTYMSCAVAELDVAVDAAGLTEDCGELELECTARDLCVQAASAECVNYVLKLDVRAYLTRRALISLRLEDDCACPQPRANSANAPRRTCNEPGCTLDALAVSAARSRAASMQQAAAMPAEAARPAQQMIRTVPVQTGGEEAYRTLVKMPVKKRRR